MKAGVEARKAGGTKLNAREVKEGCGANDLFHITMIVIITHISS